jgi:hypothetical protein
MDGTPNPPKNGSFNYSVSNAKFQFSVNGGAFSNNYTIGGLIPKPGEKNTQQSKRLRDCRSENTLVL